MKVLYCFLLLFLGARFQFLEAQNAQPVDVFANGASGYACFRIPATVRAPNGWLMAFAEGRKNGCSDHGDIDIVLKVSKNQGRSWGPLQVVVENGEFQCGNPAPVFDLMDPAFPQGRLILCYNTGTASEADVRNGLAMREVWYTTSVDLGKSWSEPVNITVQVHRPLFQERDSAYRFKADWRSYANTPGHALQLQSGRILVAANHSEGGPQNGFWDYRSHVYFSDDHGRTWNLSESVPYPGSNEATAAEYGYNKVWVNIREQSGISRRRLMAYSSDGGAHWDSVRVVAELPDPVCEGSMVASGSTKGGPQLYFCNPASTELREHLTLYRFQPTTGFWKKEYEVYAGSAAYSDIVPMKKAHIGILFERDNYTKISFLRLKTQ